MHKISIPDFNHSTLSMMNSILKSYDYPTKYSTLDKLDGELSKKYKNVVLFIFDGLGNISLEKISKKGLFNQNKVDIISSVFPSTTVAAINTIQSGVPPVEHGVIVGSAVSVYDKVPVVRCIVVSSCGQNLYSAWDAQRSHDIYHHVREVKATSAASIDNPWTDSHFCGNQLSKVEWRTQ